MVAKSYQNCKILSKPFEENKRQYIKIQLKSGKEKIVRWYSELEYKKLYPEVENIKIDHSNDKYWKSQKNTLGFEKGFITIFLGINENNQEYFKQNPIFYRTRWWDWYIKSTDKVPNNLPPGVKPIVLDWKIVAKDDETLYNDDILEKRINKFFANFYNSKPQGEIGDRIERQVVIIKTEKKEDKWGISTNHIFKDEDGNFYSWNTKSQNWPVNNSMVLSGTVKDYTTYKNEPCTMLIRCKCKN